MQRLNQLDNELEAILAVEGDVASDELQQLLQQRESLLQQLMAEPERLNKDEWQAAVERTTCLLARIRHHRDMSAINYNDYSTGNARCRFIINFGKVIKWQ